ARLAVALVFAGQRYALFRSRIQSRLLLYPSLAPLLGAQHYSLLNSPAAASSAFTAFATVALTRCSTIRSTMASIPANPAPLPAMATALGLPGPGLMAFLLPFGLPCFRFAVTPGAEAALAL